ncbi:glycosyl hydrolase [Deinococcus sp.]|uniref:glycosyl hydrolase n=1 Tax=Deinococcus sp. TaxID=47478 RepID=UPI0025F33A59|nr:glycosyl hydrolase [Deinococcus sp.]
MARTALLPLLGLALGVGLLMSCDTAPTASASQVSPLVQTAAVPIKSPKRGLAYDLASAADLAALAPGVSWWYNWSSAPNGGAPADYQARYSMDFLPMLWNGNFNTADIEARLRANPAVKYLLVMNEPNLTDQSNLSPAQAAALWPRYEQVAADTGVQLVGPAMNWGTLPGYADPVVWLDAFYAAYRSQHAGQSPRIDALVFHWYDYGLSAQLDRLTKYGKPFWVTELTNWHTGDGSAQIDSVAKQKAQMAEMVATLEARSDVQRYAWFTGRWNNDSHFTSLLGASGQLTELGRYYLSLPFAGSATPPPAAACGTGNAALGKPAQASSSENGATLAPAAFDGNAGTRWSSARSDREWIQVNLGSVQKLCQVTLQWEAAYGKAFELQVSNDGQTWTPVYSTTTGTGGTVRIPLSASGQYLRMQGTLRGSPWGYSLFEMAVNTAP